MIKTTPYTNFHRLIKNLIFITCVIAIILTVKRFDSQPEKTQFYNFNAPPPEIILDSRGLQIHQKSLLKKNGEIFQYNHTSPIIFIGGMPRSGTTLMRVLMDSHPEVSCGEETRVIPKFLEWRNNLYDTKSSEKSLENAGTTKNVVDKAMQEFLLETIVRRGDPKKFLCTKDPLTLQHQNYLKTIFPNSKFIFMIRDGRAQSHSSIKRKMSGPAPMSEFLRFLKIWNTKVTDMYEQCLSNANSCLPVYYEQLVLHPEENLKKITEFLNVPWSDNLMHHEDFIENIGIAKYELSSSQIVKPVYLDALVAWMDSIPEDLKKDIEKTAPLLGKLGYKYDFDEKAIDKEYFYGKPDQVVLDKIKKFEKMKFEHEWSNKEI